MKELRQLLEEPIASNPDDNDVYAQAQLIASIAISLKRIADTLDGTAAGLCVTDTIFGVRRER